MHKPTILPGAGVRALASADGRPVGIYQRLVTGALSAMKRGRLRMELPDGAPVLFGDQSGGVTADIRVRNWRFFKRCALYGDIGFGEAYLDGDWETTDITKVISWFLLNADGAPQVSGSKMRGAFVNLLGWQNRIRHWLRGNTLKMSRRNISEHYDLGNRLYQLFLDSTMTYSSALFRAPDQSLEEAQLSKYERLCQQLRLQPGERVLEIGCGWGGFSRYAARRYGVRVTAVTLSQEQFGFARELVNREGLHGLIEVQLTDYRQITGAFDKVVSIEMIEAVGHAHLETFFAKCQAVLKPDGLLALQMITCPDSRYESLRSGADFIQKHVFPGSLLVSIHRVNQALRKTGDLFLHDLKDMGISYAETLRRWREAFNRREKEVRELDFDTRFIRKWNYYLCYCEAAFAMRHISVVQALFTRPNNPVLMAL